MMTLYRLLARPLWVPFVMFTLIGVATTIWAGGNNLTLTNTDARIFPWLCFAAASFGARSFYGHMSGREGLYLRSLPIPTGRVSLHALVVAVTFTLLSFTVQGACAVLVDTIEAPSSAFGPWTTPELARALLVPLLTLVGSAYFACSLPHLGSARQGGMPGFFLSLWWAFAANELGAALGLHRPWIPALLLAVLTLAFLPRLASLRGVGVEQDFEEALSRVTPSTRRAWLGLQFLWLVVPMVSYVHHRGPLPAAPYLRTPAWVLDVLLWLIVGGVATAFRRRALRRAVRGGCPAFLTWAMHLSGIGLPLWRIHTFGRAGSPRETPLSSRLHRRLARTHGGMAPRTPWGYVGMAFATWFIVVLPLGGQRVLRGWTLEVETPGVELWVEGEPVDGNSLSGVRLAGPLGPWMGGMSGSGSRGRTGAMPGLPTDTGSLVEALWVEPQKDSGPNAVDGEHDPHMELSFPPIEEFFPENLDVDLRYRNAPIELSDIRLETRWDDFRVLVRVVLSVRIPGVEACVRDLERMARNGEAPDEDDILRAGELGPVLRSELADRVHGMALEVTGHYGLPRTEGAISGPANLLAPVLGALDWSEARKTPDPLAELEAALGSWRMKSPADAPWVFEVGLAPWVAMHALARGLREGHPGALDYAEERLDLQHPGVLVAVGYGQRRELAPVLYRLLDGPANRALVYALARLDPDRTAAALSERLLEDPRAEWIDGLACCAGESSRGYVTELLREVADPESGHPATLRKSARRALARIESASNPLHVWRTPES